MLRRSTALVGESAIIPRPSWHPPWRMLGPNRARRNGPDGEQPDQTRKHAADGWDSFHRVRAHTHGRCHAQTIGDGVGCASCPRKCLAPGCFMAGIQLPCCSRTQRRRGRSASLDAEGRDGRHKRSHYRRWAPSRVFPFRIRRCVAWTKPTGIDDANRNAAPCGSAALATITPWQSC